MKIFKTFIAAALALLLTACSFFDNSNQIKTENGSLANGSYSCAVLLEGGSGKASIESPVEVTITDDSMTVQLIWSSSNYDYMIVSDIRYDNEAGIDESSRFTIPFEEFNQAFTVIADTVAMSKPHEIEYNLTVYAPDYDLSTYAEETTALEEGNESIEAPSLGELKYQSSLELEYANQFSVDYYTDDDNAYAFITIGGDNSKQYFLKPINGQASEEALNGLSENIVVLNELDKTYLVSTSVMDLVANIDALDNIAFSGTMASDWYIPEAASAMESGDILYAGKYSAPDYELLVSEGCSLAIENTMIYHDPATKEKLEELGIPVMVEMSSYEDNPLGRLEWIKLYGILFDKLDLAEEFFDEQETRVENVLDLEDTDKTVGFFSINASGQIYVREQGDYIVSMIEMAKATYVPTVSSTKITMEDFYLGAADADALIYNSTIEGEVNSISDLLTRAEALSDFKAVKNGNVYCLKEDYFQKSTSVAEFIEELHSILDGTFVEGECFYRLKE